MNRLFFLSSALALAVIAGGCSSPSIVHLDPDDFMSDEIRDASGCVVTVEGDRLDMFVSAQRRVAEKAEKAARNDRDEILSKLRSKKFDCSAALARRPTDAQIRQWTDEPLSDREFYALLAVAKARYEKVLREETLPAIADKSWSWLCPVVRSLAPTNSLKARAVLQQASRHGRLTAGSPEVAVELCRRSIVMMNTELNPEAWKVIETNLTAKSVDFLERLDRVGWQREVAECPRLFGGARGSSANLLDAQRFLSGLDVQAAASKAAVARTQTFFDSVERLTDDADWSPEACAEAARREGASARAYEALLSEYAAAFCGAGCTTEDAGKIVEAASQLVSPLAFPLTDADADKKTFLGTAGLNARIDALGQRVLAEMDSRTLAKKVSAGKVALFDRVAKLNSENAYDKAREQAALACTTGDAAYDNAIGPACIELVNGTVNPAHWEAIEHEVADRRAEFDKDGDGRSYGDWLAGYRLAADNLPGLAPYANIAAVTNRGALSTAELNVRIRALVAAEKARLSDLDTARQIEAYVKAVEEAVRAGKPDEMRKVVLTAALEIPTAAADGVRLARTEVLDAVVNPRCLAAAVKAIDARAAECAKTENYEAFQKYAAAFDGRVRTDGAELRFVPGAQRPAAGAVTSLCARVTAALAGDSAARGLQPVTTVGVNAAIDARLASVCADFVKKAAARDLRRAQERREAMLKNLDKAVSFDRQLQLASEAIQAELGRTPSCRLGVNALLGEYKRVIRMLKVGSELAPGNAQILLLGGACLGEDAMVEHALGIGADVNATDGRDARRRTALLLAAETGRGNLLTRLRDAKADFARKDAAGNTVLHCAAAGGNAEFVSAVATRENVNLANARGERPVVFAVRNDREAALDALAKAGANLSAPLADGTTLFDVACVAGSAKVLDRLAKAGIAFGVPQLVSAVKENRLAVVKWLVARGVDVNGKGVMAASAEGSEVRAYLLSEGGVVETPIRVEPKAKVVQSATVAK